MKLAAIGLGGLALMGFAYGLTVEPAPSIRVRWRQDVTAQQQAALERTYLLSNGRAPMGRSIAYDLLDTRQTNVRAIVVDPAVADTNDIDRDTLVVPFDTAYGDRWMWSADRTPVLRDARVRGMVMVVLAGMVFAGLSHKFGSSQRTTQRARREPVHTEPDEGDAPGVATGSFAPGPEDRPGGARGR